MVVVSLLSVIGALGCGRIGFGTDGAVGAESGPGDSGIDSADVSDADSTDASSDAEPDSATPTSILVLGDDPGATPGLVDTYIVMARATTDHGACALLVAEGADFPSAMLFGVDLSGLPDGAVIERGALTLWTADRAGSGGAGLRVVPLRQEWQEGRECGPDGAANWIERLPGVPWAAAGAQGDARATEAWFDGPLPAGADTEVIIELPGEGFQSWLADPATNFGILVEATTSDGWIFVAREGTEGKRPSLRLAYR